MSARVLIVDDNESFLEAARTLLEREGLDVVGVASTIASGLERAADLAPDVTLVDINLAGESGFELADRLVARDRLACVILISTHAEADLADLISASPALGFLPKGELSAESIGRIQDKRPG